MPRTAPAMDIYLDTNATTPVLPQAREAALAAMARDFGNPSSTHADGLRARALVEQVRARARRVLGAPEGRLLFTSGATEGIQTAVLSALVAIRERGAGGLLLVGATEHKAVPEALRHWNAVLGLGLEIRVIPVDRDGRHDLDWLRTRAARAGLVCTMAANNETGVVSDLDGIADALAGSPALWLVDGVQALGKMDLGLARRTIDYAPFSGHKLYAPKGIGLLYVRAGAPFTPLLAGGGQEGGARAGTENMPGIAALGAVLAALEDGDGLCDLATLAGWRDRLAQALRDAFPGLQFNAPPAACLPTTLNVWVPGLDPGVLLDAFDAAGLRASGGSACSAAAAQPSPVLLAMGVPATQAAAAVRLSFGPACDEAFVDAACARIRDCGHALREPAAGEVDLSADEVRQMLATRPDAVLVDVREPAEASADEALPGHAQRVPLSALDAALPGWLALPATTPVLFCCRSGRRSAQAARALRRLGRDQAWSLAGGLAGWTAASLPAVSQLDGSPPPPSA
jgi:cysteine sulfinate desulfinase/cysteine desulfurase-like protein/rhodanese-related sulfurtransferase